MSSHYLKVDVDGINKRITFLANELLSIKSNIADLAKNTKPVLYDLDVSINKHDGHYFDIVLEGKEIYETSPGRFLLKEYLNAGNTIDLALKLDSDNINFYSELASKMCNFINSYVPEEKRYLELTYSAVKDISSGHTQSVSICFKEKWTDIPFLSEPTGLATKDWKKFYSEEDANAMEPLLEAVNKNLEEVRSLQDILKRA